VTAGWPADRQPGAGDPFGNLDMFSFYDVKSGVERKGNRGKGKFSSDAQASGKGQQVFVQDSGFMNGAKGDGKKGARKNTKPGKTAKFKGSD
jgi:hypothetical protein